MTTPTLSSASPCRAGIAPTGWNVDDIRATTLKLLDWCRSQAWAGWDPYDGLNSRLFQTLTFLHHRWPRLILIQGFKRSPVNLRRLFAVTPAVNPKGAALFLSTLVRLHRCGLATPVDVRDMAARLISLRSTGWRRACWGYHFDWQTRTYLVPRGYPNVICTSFGGESLLDAYEALGDAQYLELATEAGWFLLEDLRRTTAGDSFCFSYTPLEDSRVHNASLLGAALLARLHRATGLSQFREAAEAAARFGVNHQQPDGSWIYGEDENQGWIDSFHTGYNLLALKALAENLDLPSAVSSLKRGFIFYRQHFFEADGVVKYYHNRTYPIDSHGVAHALLTLCELASLEAGNLALAGKVYSWAVQHLRHPEGWFYYQKKPWYTNRVCYIRWTQAWMLRGLTQMLVSAGLTGQASGS